MEMDVAYSRVDTTKILDAADALDKIVAHMRQELYDIKQLVDVFDTDASWRGEAYEKWHKRYARSYKAIARDVEKYEQFAPFLRERAQRYLLTAARTQALADNLDSEVTKLVSDLLVKSGASLSEIRAAADEYYDG